MMFRTLKSDYTYLICVVCETISSSYNNEQHITRVYQEYNTGTSEHKYDGSTNGIVERYAYAALI